MKGHEMDWLDPKDLLDCGECVVRLEPDMTRRPHAAFFLGKSVHQIAYVDPEGEVWCLGKKLQREDLNGWMPLPALARQ